MPPRWLIRAVLLFAAVALSVLAGVLIWFYGWRSPWLWLLIALIVNLLVSVFWTRHSKARDLFAKGSLAMSIAAMVSTTLALLGPQSSPVEETTWLILGGAWSILLGALLIRVAVWLRSRTRPTLT